MSPALTLADAVRAVRADGRSRDICCPAHEDRAPSLSVSLSAQDVGRVLVHCHAGCLPEVVCERGALTLADLAPPSRNGGPEIVDSYDYVDEQGHLLFQVLRLVGKQFRQRRPDPVRPGEWLWKLEDTRRVLYRLPQVLAAASAGEPVWVVEGEKDVAACEAHGLVATCNPGGATADGSKTKWRKEYSESLRGAAVTVVADADPPGRAHASHIVRSLAQVGVASWRVVEAASGKDAADHFAAGLGPEDFTETRSSKPPAPGPAMRLDEMTNGDRLVELHGEEMRFVAGEGSQGQWFVWDGRRFQCDATRLARKRARAVIEGFFAMLADPRCPNRAELAKHAARYANDYGVRTMLQHAADRLAVTADVFDADPMLLNVANGTLDLRTGELRPHDRADLMTRLAGGRYGLAFDPEARCPRWEDFLWRILAERSDLIRFVQKAVGYSLTADASEECLFLLYGGGHNGKSTFVRALRALLGEYARAAAAASVLEGSGASGASHRTDLLALIGSRLVTVVEVSEGKRLNEALIKTLTGRDEHSIRGAYAKQQTVFTAGYKLWVAVNHLPEVRDSSFGMWRKMRVVPFDVTIPLEERDGNLDEKLYAELPGILNWALQGCLLWQQEQLGSAPEVEQATTSYRDESDDVGSFLADACVIAPNARTTTRALYRAYVQWAHDTGAPPMTEKRLSQRLQERGGFVRGQRSKTGIPWHGVAPKSSGGEQAPAPADGLFEG